MKKSASIFILSCILFLLPSTLRAQTFHAIIFSDTNDDRIGGGCQLDHDNVIRELGNMATYINHDFFVYDNFGEDCSKDALVSVLSDLNIEPEDVVVFYYTGHGVRSDKENEDPFPQMCLGSNFDQDFVPVQFAVNKILEYNPRLLLAFTNCCNKESEWVSPKSILSSMSGSTSLSDIDIEAYKKLFLDGNGYAIMTSSQPGQYSYTQNEKGSFFTNDLLEVLYIVGKGKVQPEWEEILKNVKQKTSSYDIQIAEPPYKFNQIPYYENYISRNGDNGNRRNIDKKKDRIEEKERKNDDVNQLHMVLNRLIDPSLGRDSRLAMIPQIAKEYFYPGAKVLTVGRNGMIVDREDATDFLRRVALSRRIAGITIVQSTRNEKQSEIKVHEIHR